jgi:hypothetical protein
MTFIKIIETLENNKRETELNEVNAAVFIVFSRYKCDTSIAFTHYNGNTT